MFARDAGEGRDDDGEGKGHLRRSLPVEGAGEPSTALLAARRRSELVRESRRSASGVDSLERGGAGVAGGGGGGGGAVVVASAASSCLEADSDMRRRRQ